MQLKDLLDKFRKVTNIAIVADLEFVCVAPVSSKVLEQFYDREVIELDILHNDGSKNFEADMLVVLEVEEDV